ncbi:tripartite tricarboxylate transporter substrate binding protein [Sinirhodobacter sp. WL0062]|uniref:Tripartite tricarboxylate transporter substrate binding protein n=1 Tax=Rhodobacter flavimaris TaxID=2907145 RepID=A0ABS8Z0Q9_9RHOB|nr:tripartite tricarboxylate transporter substrate binding protein [Sinirhodobacter sp. WL0062]MCE5975000.1 tripartite tricarboxylate transporter substrate binding protein [Sinirhodobacter sp. WL0062]
MRTSLIALVAALSAAPALADTWPSQTIRIVVGFTPGGSSDLVARLLAPLVSEDLGTEVIVENMPGAASTIAAATVAEANADGYTFFLSNVSANGIAPFTYPTLGYDPVADFNDVTILGYIPAVLLASKDAPVSTLEEFLAQAKAEPVLFGSGGHGTMNHVSGELLNMSAGLKMEHVAYKGSAEAMNDLLASVIDYQFDALTQNIGQINAGAIKALAITTPERSPAAPEIPTFAELGLPEVVAFNWVGLSAPAGTPDEIIAKFYEATHKAMQDAKIKAQFTKWGMFHVDSTPAEAEAFVADEVAKWGKVVHSAPVFN